MLVLHFTCHIYTWVLTSNWTSIPHSSDLFQVMLRIRPYDLVLLSLNVTKSPTSYLLGSFPVLIEYTFGLFKALLLTPWVIASYRASPPRGSRLLWIIDWCAQAKSRRGLSSGIWRSSSDTSAGDDVTWGGNDDAESKQQSMSYSWPFPFKSSKHITVAPSALSASCLYLKKDEEISRPRTQRGKESKTGSPFRSCFDSNRNGHSLENELAISFIAVGTTRTNPITCMWSSL